MTEYTDPNPITPEQPEYDQNKIPSMVKNYTKQVREKIYGRWVREALARSVDIIGIVSEEARVSSNEAIAITQSLLDGTFDDAELATKIEEKLNQLEHAYAPKLNQAISDIENLPTKDYVEDGDYKVQTMMKPVTITDGAITKLLNTALTYIGRTNIVYGNDFTPFSDLRGTKNGKFEMDCSSFIQCCVTGTTYSNSAYFHENNFYDESYYPLIDPKRKRGRMLAHQQAKYCFDNGMAFEPAQDWSNVRVGDLIFFSVNFDEGFWRDIGHVAIVSRIDQAGKITVFEAISGRESGCVESTYEIAQMNGSKKANLCARLPLKDVEVTPKLISINNRSGARAVFTKKKLELNKMYTFFMKADLGERVYPILNAGAGNIYSFTSSVIKRPDGMYKANFFISEKGYDNQIDIFLPNSNSNEVIEFTALYDGYLTSCPDNVDSNLKPVLQHTFTKSVSIEPNAGAYASFRSDVDSVLDEMNYYFVVDVSVSGNGATTVISSINEASRKAVSLYNSGSGNRDINVRYTLTQILKD